MKWNLDALIVFVRRVHRSGTLREVLKRNGATLQLVEEVPTRWGSRCDMLERLLKLKTAVMKTAMEMTGEDDILTTAFLESLGREEIWDQIHTWVRVLQPLQELTEFVGRGDEITMSSLPLALHTAINKLPADHLTLAKEVKEAMTQRFKQWLESANIGE